MEVSLFAWKHTQLIESENFGAGTVKVINYERSIFDFMDNEHLAALVKPGEKQVIWEDRARQSRKRVLNPIETKGQELLLQFIGASCIIMLLLIVFLHVLSFHSFHVPC